MKMKELTRSTLAQMSVAALIAVIIATTPALFANSPPSTQGSGTNTAVTSCNLSAHLTAPALACSPPDSNNAVGCNFAFPIAVEGNSVTYTYTEIATITRPMEVSAGSALSNSAHADGITATTTNTCERGGPTAIPALIVPSAAAVNTYSIRSTRHSSLRGPTARSGPSHGTPKFFRT